MLLFGGFQFIWQEARVESYKSASDNQETFAKESCALAPSQHAAAASPQTGGAWLGAARSSEVTWLICSPCLSHCRCSQSARSRCTFSQCSRQCFACRCLRLASFPQGFNTSRQQTPVAQQGTQEQHGGKTHLEITPWNYSWLCPPSPQHRTEMPSWSPRP